MKKTGIWGVFTVLFFLNPIFYQPTIYSQQTINEVLELEKLKNEVTSILKENILPFWTNNLVDYNSGGFYGRVDGNNELHKDSDRGGILNARILWTYSAAFRTLKDDSYLKIANHSRNYILNHFIDHENGGAYYRLNSNGEPEDMRKQSYTQSFFIYGLTEYYLATGDTLALNAAKDIYFLLEKHSFDSVNNGYFEVCSPNWERINDKMIGEKSASDIKGMNTHLHLMEAYSNLYRARPDKHLKNRLTNLIELFCEKIIDPKTFHLIYFMNEKWEASSPIVSYGHDIEASWLLTEAAMLIDNSTLTSKVKTLSLKLADAVYEGILEDGSTAYEKNILSGEINRTREWWAEAETVVGYLNAYELSGNEKYLNTALNSWDFIKNNFIDYTNGEWYNQISESGSILKLDKAGFWKCPYHNSRMCIEIILRTTKI